MRRLVLLVSFLLFTASLVLLHAQTPPHYAVQGSVNVAPATPKLTAVDPMAYAISADVLPARPFLYTVDKDGITITRFNDNKIVGYWAWPKDVIYTVLPDGGFAGLTPPVVWEPVAMTVSYPTEAEIANRVKEIPDLTPPWTFVYVVMAHSGYGWRSGSGVLRDTIIPNADPATDSSMLIQIDVSDPSFSTRNDGVAPVYPHVAAALVGHGASQPVYDRSTGNVYVSNMPSNSLPPSLSSFVSVIRRIPPTVTAEEREVPGVAIPVIRCGPQHPESGIPVGRPQAYACYDPSGVHPIDDNEHVGAFGNFDWQFRNLPDWLKVAYEVPCATGVPAGVHCSKDGILYGTPQATGEWFAEARVHNLDDEYGIFSYWAPIRLLVTPTAEYLPVRVEFAAGVPVAYPLEGTGSCSLPGAPSWVDVVQVPNGCVVMGKAPLDGEHYNFSMPGFTVAGYPALSLVFSGNVFGEYGFVPLPAGVGLSGLAWHQVSKVADPSTETAVLSLEYIGVEPSAGQLYRILAPPGRPQPPNERPPETALTLDVVSPEGSPLAAALTTARPEIAGHLVRFGQVAIEADRDIFVLAETDSTISDGALIKVSGGTPGVINLTGMQASYLDLDSDLRTAIVGVEPGQVDHGALLVSGATGNVAVIDTAAGTVSQTLSVAGPLGSISVDIPTRYAYVAAESSQSVAILAPDGSTRPPMKPRIWSSEEFTFNVGYPSVAPEPFKVMATGDPIPTLSLLGELPAGVTFTPSDDGTATISGIPEVGGEFAFTILATGSSGSYAQSFGITVYTPATITSANAATFVAGSASSFTVTVEPDTAILYTWDEALLPKGVILVDNENGTASLVGTPEQEGTYVFRLGAQTSYPTDAEQVFTLTVVPATSAGMLPVITSPSTVTWEVIGAPFSPDMFTITSIGSPTPTLSVIGTLPPGVSFIDNHDSTGILGGGCVFVWPTQPPSCLGTLPAAAAGNWTFTIRATNSAGYTEQTFTLVIETNTSIMGASPSTLSFGYTFGGTLPASQTVRLTTLGDTLPYALVSTAPWLSAAPVSGTMPTDITVSVDPSGLAAGSYTGTVLVTSAATEGPFATIAVTLNVSADPSMAITPTALSFQFKVVDGRTPPAQTLSLSSGGVPMGYTVASEASWLSATPSSGATPGGVSVSVNPSGLGVGTYHSAVTIASGGAVNRIPVTLTKTWSAANLFNPMIDFMADVGGEGLTINLNTHQLFINAAMEAAAGGSEAGENSTAPEAPTPIVPTTVLHVNPIDKTVVAAMGVHSEGEYVAVNSKTGLVYHASQGTGEIAVMDGSNDTTLGYIPLMVDGLVFLPYQIAIDEGQNFIYVGTKAPTIVDPPHVAPFPCKAIHELPDDEYDCWNPGRVFVIDGKTNKIVSSFIAGDDPEGVVFAAATNKVYASNEDDGSVTVAQGAVRNGDGSITAPQVSSTIIRGQAVRGSWHPTCDANNFCGERGQAALWPQKSACNGIDDEAEEADKMVVDPEGNVYIIDDRYRVAKIKGDISCSAGCGAVEKVLEIDGYDCEAEVPDGSNVVFRNTANNIAFSAPDKKDPTTWRLYVISEQNTISVIDPVAMTISETITVPDAVELDAATADPALNRLYVTDEATSTLWILQGACADGKTDPCVQPKDPADFVFGATPSTQTINAGQNAQYAFTINASSTFNGSVALTCTSGLPKGAACSFSPSSVAPGPNGVGEVVLTITTTPRKIASVPATLLPRSGVLYATLLPIAGLALAGFVPTRRRRSARRIAALIVLLALLPTLALVGCGGGGSAITPIPTPDSSTPSGTYSVTVSASSGNLSHSTIVNVAVN